MEQTALIQAIQNALTPAVMISSSGLFLLGFQNKFSALFDRFRTLNEEKRELKMKTGRNQIENNRLDNLEEQLTRLTKRAGHVKNAILSTYLAIIAFLTTSLFLFWSSYSKQEVDGMTLVSFGIGLGLLFLAAVSIMIEVTISYNILKIEKKS